MTVDAKAFEAIYQKALQEKSGPVYDAMIAVYEPAAKKILTESNATGQNLTQDQIREAAWKQVHSELIKKWQDSYTTTLNRADNSLLVDNGIKLLDAFLVFLDDGDEKNKIGFLDRMKAGAHAMREGGSATLEQIKDAWGRRGEKGWDGFIACWKENAGKQNMQDWVAKTFSVQDPTAQKDFLANLENSNLVTQYASIGAVMPKATEAPTVVAPTTPQRGSSSGTVQRTV